MNYVEKKIIIVYTKNEIIDRAWKIMFNMTDEMLASTFAIRTNARRKQLKITREELAQYAEISTSTLASYLREKEPVVPMLRAAIRMADKLGVSLAYLCGLENEGDFTPNGLSAEVILKNLYRSILEAQLNWHFENNKVVLESDNRFIMSFLIHIKKDSSRDKLDSSIFKHFKDIKLWKGRMVTDEEYKELSYIEYVYGDITEGDDLYPDELNGLIELRKQHWEQTGGNPTEYLHEEREEK